MITRLISLALLIGPTLCSTAQAETQLFVATSSKIEPQVTISYPSSIRIKQAVQDALVQLPNHNTAETSPQSVYWLGAALLDLNNISGLETSRRNVLNILEQMNKTSHNGTQLKQLIQYLRDLKLGQRVKQPLDIDLIRINDAYNAKIDGRYQLILPARPTTVTLLGAISHNDEQAWQARKESREYVQQAGLLDDAEKSFVWIIQPDGEAIRQPVGYWNHQAQDIAPGAILYVEFSNLFDGYANLNKDIIELLKNRTL